MLLAKYDTVVVDVEWIHTYKRLLIHIRNYRASLRPQVMNHQAVGTTLHACRNQRRDISGGALP